MDKAERELILKLQKESFLLRKLYSEHRELDKQASRFDNRPFLTSCEQAELKALKIKKLRGVDKMMSILADYKRQEAGAEAAA